MQQAKYNVKDKIQKIIYIIDVTISLDTKIISKYEEKIYKYYIHR